MPTFIVKRNDKTLGTFVIKKKMITIGRSRENTISIDNNTISRYHVCIEKDLDDFICTDLGSLNGTFVNGKRVQRFTLSSGDRLQLGMHVIVYHSGEKQVQQLTEKTQPTEERLGGKRPTITLLEEDGQDMHVHIEDRSPDRAGTALAGDRKNIIPFTVASASRPTARETSLVTTTQLVDTDCLVILVRPNGSIDQTNAKKFNDLLDGLLSGGGVNILLDLQDLKSVSSAGWGMLARQLKKVQEFDGSLKLANIRPEVFEAFRLLSFHKHFSCFPSVEKALDSYKGDDAV